MQVYIHGAIRAFMFTSGIVAIVFGCTHITWKIDIDYIMVGLILSGIASALLSLMKIKE